PAGKIGSFTIPSSVTSIESNAFQDCSGLTTINIPSSVTSIGSETFSGCSGLTSISIPSSVTSIGSKAFSGCSGLTSISIPSSVTSIGSETFSGCSGLTSISIPSSVTSIGYSAFEGCSGLTSISIPSSVTSIGYSAFEGCTLCPLLLSTKLRRDNEPRQIYSCLIGLNASSAVFAYSSEINLIQLIWDGTVGDIERPYVIHTPKNYLRSISFNIIANNLIPASLLNVKIGNNKTPYKEIAPDENGLYSITGLEINTSYYIEITYKFENGETNSITQEIKTLDPKLSQYVSTTQTTATININASSDESCSPTIRYDFNGKSYNCTENKIVFSDLIPGKNYPITIYADYNGKILRNSTSFTTESLKPTITLQASSPTSISVKGSYTVKDAHVTETGFEGYDTDNTLTLTGLKPSTPYTINYYVKTEEGSNEIASQTFTTSDLELTTLQPRCVSSSCAIVAATTNISEEEMNVGFQWKKYDAPSSLKPNEGYAAIYGGQLEGYIRNLQSTSYYNVRAFYKSVEGDYFYGDWITFDPSDFSYFEPTVHTYAAAEVTHNSARMKGYILAGTEAIEEQGFEYWSTSTSSASARRVKAATTASDNVQTVFATGQVMTAELRDLLPATTYCCRAFVKTSSGITYGEEQTFTTQGDPTGIGFVSPDAPTTPIVEGYYDLNGRKFETPQRGINIIRYSNGTTRKIVVR
ncbi:MAG: leucine-rich repeat domain-containing protein, partial [Paraprevotella sp.]|nr:leucine-rich repeat domain-containing protein [Paraprevotella sp.]